MVKSSSSAHSSPSNPVSVQPSIDDNDGVAYLAAALSGIKISKCTANVLVQALRLISQEDKSSGGPHQSTTAPHDEEDEDPEAAFFGNAASVSLDDEPPSDTKDPDYRCGHPCRPPAVTACAANTTPSPNAILPVTLPGPGKAILTDPPGLRYRGYIYNVPPPKDAGPFYCVTKGLRVGIFSAWQGSAALTQGVSRAVQSKVSSVQRGIDIFEQTLEAGGVEVLL